MTAQRPAHPLTAHAVGDMSSLDTVAALFPPGGGSWLRSFAPEQLATLARLT